MYKNRIREYRERRGYKLQELADKVGITAGYLSHLERGERDNPSTEVMENIASALNASIAKIFFNG